LSLQRDAWRAEINQLEEELKILWGIVEKEVANPTTA
jgi:hypothetical protein